MSAERWKQVVMSACFALLILAMSVAIIRSGTNEVLIKHFHMDNAFTRLVFSDSPDIYLRRKVKPEKKINWAKEYPFPETEPSSTFSEAGNMPALEQHVTKKMEPDIEEWNMVYVWQVLALAEAGRRYEETIGWQVVDPSKRVARLADGNLTFAFPHDDQQERIDSMAKLADFAAGQGAKLLFVQAPTKTNAFGDEAVNGRLDFSNQNADELLAGLRQHGIEVLDLRENLHAAAPTSEEYHRFFYRTDHHWRPQTALFAADLLAQRLEAEGIPMDRTAYEPERYQVETLPAFFLGSQGKKVTLAEIEPDDFDIVTPKFPVKLHVEIPSCEIDAVGGFDLLFDPHQIERRDYYNLDPYHFYGHGDVPLLHIENLDQPDTGKKLLFIRDSFCDTLVPYLSLGCRQVTALDLRNFTGSVETFIREEKPDVIVVMYTTEFSDKIKWEEHRDQFDFR